MICEIPLIPAPLDAELILEYEFEVAEAYLEWIDHHKKASKCLIL